MKSFKSILPLIELKIMYKCSIWQFFLNERPPLNLRKLLLFLRKTKKVYNANINEKEVADNRKIGNTVKPFLLDEVISQEKFTLVKNSKIITQDTKIADGLNLFFANVVTFNVPASRLIHDFFYQKDNKELKLMMIIVYGRRLYLVYLKGQWLELYYSTSF